MGRWPLATNQPDCPSRSWAAITWLTLLLVVPLAATSASAPCGNTAEARGRAIRHATQTTQWWRLLHEQAHRKMEGSGSDAPAGWLACPTCSHQPITRHLPLPCRLAQGGGQPYPVAAAKAHAGPLPRPWQAVRCSLTLVTAPLRLAWISASGSLVNMCWAMA